MATRSASCPRSRAAQLVDSITSVITRLIRAILAPFGYSQPAASRIQFEGENMATTVTRTPGMAPGRTLSKDEIQRYSRHLIMPEVGMEGQLKLANAKVLMIGAGGLGAPLGLYLAAAGVGRLGIVDFDVV